MKRSADQQRVIGYVRVSTSDQNLGPEAQRAAIERWCADHGLVLVAVHQDLGISGGAAIEKRPGLLAALDSLARENAGALLVAKRDRLARDTMICAMIERLAERSGARVLSADGSNADGPEGMLMRGMIDLFAQYERAVIRGRTRAALAVKRSRSERCGMIPYGYQLAADGMHTEENPSEQRVIGLIRDLRSEGFSQRAIAERLNADQIPARGARWHKTTIARIAA
jgi:site-specific DNA recombinase